MFLVNDYRWKYVFSRVSVKMNIYPVDAERIGKICDLLCHVSVQRIPVTRVTRFVAKLTDA